MNDNFEKRKLDDSEIILLRQSLNEAKYLSEYRINAIESAIDRLEKCVINKDKKMIFMFLSNFNAGPGEPMSSYLFYFECNFFFITVDIQHDWIKDNNIFYLKAYFENTDNTIIDNNLIKENICKSMIIMTDGKEGLFFDDLNLLQKMNKQILSIVNLFKPY